MDLAKLDLTEHANSGAELEVLHPITGENLLDDNGEKVVITLLGADSTKMRGAMSDRARKQLSQKKAQVMSLDQAEETSSELLSAITIGWRGFVENGEVIPCTEENAKRLYTKYAWLRLQVDAFVSDRANFFKA